MMEGFPADMVEDDVRLPLSPWFDAFYFLPSCKTLKHCVRQISAELRDGYKLGNLEEIRVIRDRQTSMAFLVPLLRCTFKLNVSSYREITPAGISSIQKR